MLQEVPDAFSVLNLKLENLLAVDIYRILRGVLISVHFDDVILLYVLTRIHPQLPEFIRQKYRQRDPGSGTPIVSIKDDILRDADEFVESKKDGCSKLDTIYGTRSSPPLDWPSKTEQSFPEESIEAQIEERYYMSKK